MLVPSARVIAWSFVVGLSAPAIAQSSRPELPLRRLSIARQDAELSGIAERGGRWHVVSDGPSDLRLFELRSLGGDRFEIAKGLDLSKLDGFEAYKAALADVAGVEPPDRRFDLEGLAVCGETTYVVDERVRQVIVIEGGKTLRKAPLDLTSVEGLFAGGANAGFEGVAADCKGKILYVAKERDPRFILRVDMANWKVVGRFDVQLSDRAGQTVINPFTGEGLFAIGPDFSDLYYESGHLYALERNTYEIAKIDVASPGQEKVVARVSYYLTEKPLYETGEPFGIGEALFMTKDEILVGLDNNGTALSRAGEKKTGVSGKKPALLRFTRPAGF